MVAFLHPRVPREKLFSLHVGLMEALTSQLPSKGLERLLCLWRFSVQVIITSCLGSSLHPTQAYHAQVIHQDGHSRLVLVVGWKFLLHLCSDCHVP